MKNKKYFKVNPIDDNHIQFSGFIDTDFYDEESFINGIEDMSNDISEGNCPYGMFVMNGRRAANVSKKEREVSGSHKITSVAVDKEHGVLHGVMEIMGTDGGQKLKFLIKQGKLNYLEVYPKIKKHIGSKHIGHMYEFTAFDIALAM